MSFDKILKFEQALGAFTGAPFVIMTDCCTHALELCFRHDKIEHTRFTAYTYLSVPMLMYHLGIRFELTNEEWVGEYSFLNTMSFSENKNVTNSFDCFCPSGTIATNFLVLSYGNIISVLCEANLVS